MHCRSLIQVSSAIGIFATQTAAWYQQVHSQIGYVADRLVNPETQYMLAQILEPKYGGSIGRAAAWADGVARGDHATAPYSYTWHWISARDDPPNDCGLFYHRDCQAGGCVVQQIHNQTEILRPCVAALASGDYKSDGNCENALKWVIHFIMDVAEPMHTSLRAFGGNGVSVTFNGTETNLHQVWDRWILCAGTDHPNGFSDDIIDPYFLELFTRIEAEQAGKALFREPIDEWAACHWDIDRGTYCAEKWAQDSNAIVCDYAYGRLVNGSDVYKDGYAAGAFHIVELQLAKAAWRTAGWLDAIAGKYLAGPSDAQTHQHSTSQIKIDL